MSQIYRKIVKDSCKTRRKTANIWNYIHLCLIEFKVIKIILCTTNVRKKYIISASVLPVTAT